MKTKTIQNLVSGLLLSVVATLSAQSGDPVRGTTVPPEKIAQRKEVGEIISRAVGLINTGHLEEAVPILESAVAKEDIAYDHSSSAKYELAKLLVRLDRSSEALNVYRRAFKWDVKRKDLVTSGPDGVHMAMDYAMLLAKSGRKEEAKSIYYFGLRHLNWPDGQSRFIEPVPFLVVFDEEAEGITWEYTIANLEAAATMAQVARGAIPVGQMKEMIRRVAELKPDWFFPLLWKSSEAWTDQNLPLTLAQMREKASPGLETRLLQKFEEELVEHRAAKHASGTPLTPDTRPMKEGIERRSRMLCLKPNQEVLRRITIGW